MKQASALLAQQLKKPERYIMVSIKPETDMLFAGDNTPLAYLELKSIGLPEASTAALSAALCRFVSEHLAIEPDRIYIEFSNASGRMWGWNGDTF
jgi:phenylpyruvate tautomerase PptA (4-oxalocrotonate tautomerase family)